MSSTVRRTIIRVLGITILTFLLIEGMLRIADPLGLVYFDDIHTFFNQAIPTDYGYRFNPGTYTLANWSFSIDEASTRHVPSNNSDGMKVIFVGDSVTFGWGVNDADTWINLVAQDLGINAVNAGQNGYNATQVLATINTYPSESRFVFVTNPNDQEEPVVPTPRGQMPRLSAVLLWLTKTTFDLDPAYASSMQTIADDPRVLILAFDNNDYGNMVERDYGASVIPAYTSLISAVDKHADTQGNRELAAGAAPVIKQWLDQEGT